MLLGSHQICTLMSRVQLSDKKKIFLKCNKYLFNILINQSPELVPYQTSFAPEMQGSTPVKKKENTVVE